MPEVNLTPDEEIGRRLKEACDRRYYDGIYRDQCRAFGDKLRSQDTGKAGSDSHPDYEAVIIDRVRAGRSRRLMNSAFIHLSKIVSGQVEPTFPQVDKWTGEVRKQFYTERTRGNYFGLEGISEENAAMFLDGDQLGTGFTWWKLKQNPRTRQLYACAANSPALHTLWDAHARHPGRSRYWAPVLYVPADEARRRWGKDPRVEGWIQKYYCQDSDTGVEALKVYWYEDVGSEDGEISPTISIIPVSFGEVPLAKYENPTGRLNMSYYVHWVTPGMRRPVGRIVLGSATQEVLNIMEDRMLRTLKRPDVDILDLSGVNERDWNDYLAGRRTWVRSKGMEPAKVAQRIPGDRLHPEFPVIRDWYERQFNADSGTTDYDQGTQPNREVTLGEAERIDQRGQITNVWARLQYLASQIRSVDACLALAKAGDRDPVTLDVFGYNVPINSDDPASAISEFLDEPSRVYIDPDSLDSSAREARRERRKLDLMDLASSPAFELVNPVWFAEEMTKACTGLQDPREALIPGLPGVTAGAVPGLNTSGLEGMDAGMNGLPAPAGQSAPLGA